MNHSNLDYPFQRLRELDSSISNTLSEEEFKNYYLNKDYETYLIEYIGDIREAMANIDYARIYITQKFFGILFVQKGMIVTLLESVPQITNIERNYIYVLSELVANNELVTPGIIYEDTIPLDGEGVIVGIIGTGIDYLNPRFMKRTGESRIVAIWDETINTGPTPEGIPYGTEYYKENINEAITAAELGRNPYEIVPHRDEIGHGTAIAGLIGGRSLNELVRLKSMAPKCEFAIVKLEEARDDYLEFAGLESNTKNAYQVTSISSALQYLSDLQVRLKKSMVVYLPLGSNFGSRDASSILERYIDNLTNRPNFSVVTDTGNQGRGYTHAGGLIGATGETEEIFVNLGAGQRTLSVVVYTERPDIISIGITSPLGNTVTGIPAPVVNQSKEYIIVEENGLKIEYLVKENITGTISVNMIIRNTNEGVWKISLFGQLIISGRYDLWIPHSELLKEDTRFLNPNPNTTFLTPSSSNNIIVTAYYNQIDNSIIESSGNGFPREGIIKPSFSTGAVNFLTVGLNNSLIFASGGAMAGAILAGAVTMIYQWGIEEGKYPQLYPPLLKNLLIAATEKDENIIYPNREWGYGRLDINKLYEVMVAISSNIKNRDNDIISRNNNGNSDITTNNNNNSRVDKSYVKDESSSYLYISIPFEVYKRIRDY